MVWKRLARQGFAESDGKLARLEEVLDEALADGEVRPVYEANVVDVQGGIAQVTPLDPELT